MDINKKMIELEKKFADIKEKMIKDHKKEIEDKIYDFNNKFPHNPKPSSDIINYRKMIKGLVKQKEYEKAKIIQVLLNNANKMEKQKWSELRDKKLKYELDSKNTRHKMELNNFEIRLKKGLTSFNKYRSTENEKLTLKFNNKLKELEATHRIESIEFKNVNTYHSKLLSGELSSKILIILEEAKNRLFSNTDNLHAYNKL